MHFRFFNRALRILLVTNGLVLVAGAMLGPIYALFVEEIGGTLLDASLTGGVFALAAAITTLLAGKHEDKMPDESRAVVFGFFVVGLGYLGYLLVDNIWTLFAVQAVIGFGEAVYAPAFDALYGKHVTPKKAAREWGAWEAMDYVVNTAGAVVGGLIVVVFGFKTLFVIMAALCLVSAFYIHIVPSRVLD